MQDIIPLGPQQFFCLGAHLLYRQGISEVEGKITGEILGQVEIDAFQHLKGLAPLGKELLAGVKEPAKGGLVD